MDDDITAVAALSQLLQSMAFCRENELHIPERQHFKRFEAIQRHLCEIAFLAIGVDVELSNEDRIVLDITYFHPDDEDDEDYCAEYVGETQYRAVISPIFGGFKLAVRYASGIEVDEYRDVDIRNHIADMLAEALSSPYNDSLNLEPNEE